MKFVFGLVWLVLFFTAAIAGIWEFISLEIFTKTIATIILAGICMAFFNLLNYHCD